MSKRGLGRGLDALLPSTPAAPENEDGALRVVPVSAIVPNPRQPRREFDEATLDELAASVRMLGILQPLLVRDLGGGRYELVAGERRWRAAMKAELDEVPVLVVETDESGSLARAIVENVHRQDLNAVEEAAAFRQLIEEGGLTQEALGERIGKNRATIANALRLLDLPIGVQRAIAERKLTGAHGKALLALEGNVFLERLARRAAEERWSVRETEEQVKRYQSMAAGTGPGPRAGVPTSAVALEAQRRLADRLQTKVRVQLGQRKGKIVIDFVSLEELERISNLVVGQSAPGSSAIPL